MCMSRPELIKIIVRCVFWNILCVMKLWLVYLEKPKVDLQEEYRGSSLILPAVYCIPVNGNSILLC